MLSHDDRGAWSGAAGPPLGASRATLRYMADDRAQPDLYETDFYAWTQAQAQALRAPGAVNSNVIEWARVAEEIEDLGSEQRHAVLSHLLQIIIHLHKLEASRAIDPRKGWQVEVMQHRTEIDLRLTASIRNSLADELGKLHRKGARFAQKSLDLYELEVEVDAGRSWPLEELLGERDDPLDRLET